MITTSDHSDVIGAETLSIISAAEKFNGWMYEEIRPFLHGQVLELGSGIGNISKMVLNDKFETILSDYNEDYVIHLKKTFAGIPNFRNAIMLDLQNTDFESQNHLLHENFDTIFLLNVIEHLKDDVAAVSNCKFMLKPGGQLILLAPSYRFLYCDLDKNLGHYRRYTKNSLAEILKKNKLEIVEKKYFNLAGIAGWLIWGKFLGKEKLQSGSMRVFNKMVPIVRFADKLFLKKIGLSVIVAGKKNNLC